MLIQINGAKCVGIDAVPVTVEVSLERGIGIHLVGLADAAVKESLLRTTTAMEALGFRIPGKQIIINLAPADMRKNGSGYDLPIAVGIIAASQQLSLPGAQRYLIMGELGLDGSVRSIPGALPFAELAGQAGLQGAILPKESASEAALCTGVSVYGVNSLNEVLRILSEEEDCSDLLVHPGSAPYKAADAEMDFADIVGQEGAKRAMEIAAAGCHNVLLLGSPGCGKSSLAKALPGILPPMTDRESLLTRKIYSIAGKGVMNGRPFRAPHCSASLAAIIGGGGGADGIMPGEVTLATGGVLFLDELGQMPRSVIEALRAPLEDGRVTISRLHGKVEYPSDFMLVAASNPCPCGYWGEGDRCTCTPAQRAAYLGKLSAPIIDRIDLQCTMRSVDSSKIVSACKAEPSSVVAGRVLGAREIQRRRFAAGGYGGSGPEGGQLLSNGRMTNRQIEKYCPLSPSCRDTMVTLMNSVGLSMRAYFRIIRVARTIADLEAASEGVDASQIQPRHLMEAAGYRFLDRNTDV